MAEQKHSLMPWKKEIEYGEPGEIISYDIRDANGRCVMSLPFETNESDIDLIVRTVNSHQEVIKILNKAKEIVKDVLKDSGECDHSVNYCVCPLINFLDKTDDLLAKLEEVKNAR